jgi:probable rRNA maturation factor
MEDDTPDQHINIQIAIVYTKTNPDTARLKHLVRTICERFEIEKALISIAIVDDEHIERLNEQFLSREETTDCLSFDLSDDTDQNEKCFEIVVNAELAYRIAEQTSHCGETELALYITHGLLHQLGFDDHDPDHAPHRRKYTSAARL